MIRILAVTASAALLYPLFAMLAGSGTPTAETVKIVTFPVLVGAVAAIVNRKKEPLAASAIAAALAVVAVGIAGIILRLYAGNPESQGVAALAKGYTARSIIAFFFGLAGGAVTFFFASIGRRPGKKVDQKSHTYSITAGIVMAVLWGIFGVAVLAQKGQGEVKPKRAASKAFVPLADDAPIAECIAQLRSGEIMKMDAARYALMEKQSAAVEPVIACLADDRARVRYYAVKILGDLRDRRAIEPLQKLLKNLPATDQNAYGTNQEAILAAELPNAIKAALAKIQGGR